MAVIGYNVYKKGVKINDDLIFGQSLETDDSEENCYTLRAYSNTPENSGISEESQEKCTPDDVAIRHHPESKPRVYPSVTSDILHIESNSIIKNISLYDTAGYLVKYINHAAPSISLKDLAKGLYVIKIQTTREISAYKIIRS